MTLLRALAAAVLTGLFAALLTGCSGLPESGEKGYTTGEGTVIQLAPDERGDPVSLKADGVDDEAVDLADTRGRPTVVVVWGSWCVECREEQHVVNEVVEELAGTAHFVGLDVRDNVPAARAYEREFDVPYRSIDASDGQAVQAFHGQLTPYTVPSFVVLDARGRPAASVIGQLPSKLTMTTLVEEVAAEGG